MAVTEFLVTAGGIWNEAVVTAATTNDTDNAQGLALHRNATAILDDGTALAADPHASKWTDTVPAGRCVEGAIVFQGPVRRGGKRWSSRITVLAGNTTSKLLK